MIEKLEEFIKSVKDKNFKITFQKIFKRSPNLEPGSEEHFFCSELVASAYKSIGVLPNDIPACNYWPSHFGDNHDLRLVNAELGPELLIDFNISQGHAEMQEMQDEITNSEL